MRPTAATACRPAPLVERSGWPDGAEVEVAVLGPVEVRGAARPFERAWTLELVVYLALHPRGAPNEAWVTALWPDRLMAAPTVHSTASAARRALGRAARGNDHLPRGQGSLRLAGTVCTDWERLCRLSAGEDPDGWAAGLALVRGRPFEGLRNPDWTVLEGVAAEIEEGVVQLAIRLAEHRLAVGDGAGAAGAARHGLRACPFDERLYRLVLRAADRQGNPAGVESAMGDLLKLLSGECDPWTPAGQLWPWAVECLHPETAALYRALSRRPRGAAAGRACARL